MKIDDKNNLTELLLEYRESGVAQIYTRLTEEIMKYAYDFPSLISSNSGDHGGAFALYVVDKIPKIIDKFVYYGQPFEGYLYITLRHKFLSYINDYNKKEAFVKDFFVFSNFKALEIPTCVNETHIIYSKTNKEHASDLRSIFEELLVYFSKTAQLASYCKRLWIFLLKYSVFLQDETIYDIAETIGISRTKSLETLQTLSSYRETQRENKFSREEKCQNLFSRVVKKEIYFNKNYPVLTELERKNLLSDLSRVRAIYIENMRLLKNRSFCITNIIIAEILKLPQSTVDTAVFQFRKMCQKYFYETHLAKK